MTDRQTGSDTDARVLLASIVHEYRRYKSLADSAMGQLTEAELAEQSTGESNSVATIAWHVAGNLASRFTDFLTTDGEKSWRDRDSEFHARSPAREELSRHWEKGWRILFETLERLSDGDLERVVTIRGSGLTVYEALFRSLAHAAYHVGQMVFIAKAIRGSEWEYLSIAPGESETYNRNPIRG